MTSHITETEPQVTKHYRESFSFRRFIRAYSAQLGILGVFLALWLIFIIAAPDVFLNKQIYFALMSTIPYFAIMAIPLTIVVIAKEIDLSFTSVMAMGMVAFSFIYNETAFIGSANIRVGLAIIAALLAGTIIGWLNGFIIVKFGIPSLVVTLGTQFLWAGAVLVLTQGANFTLTYVNSTIFYPLFVGFC
jgi:simple sugar transport system permease protein